MITIYLISTSKNDVTKVFEIDFEEDIFFATEVQLPREFASNEYLQQGILIISATREWNLLGFKNQDISQFSKPILSSLFCGQLKDDFTLLNKHVV